MQNIWNVILNVVDGDKVKASQNNPKESGDYLCTCVQFWNGKEVSRYFQIMRYNAVKGYWHDCSSLHGISHTILAWTDKILPCDFQDFDYLGGGVLVEKSKY